MRININEGCADISMGKVLELFIIVFSFNNRNNLVFNRRR